jgi:hypothetical protein
MEKLFFKKIELWVVLLIVMLGIVFSVMLAGAVRHNMKGGDKTGKLASVVNEIASLPANINKLIATAGGDKVDLEAQSHRFNSLKGFQFNYTANTRPDLGYVLVNRYDGDVEYSVFELFDLNTQKIVHKWNVTKLDSVWASALYEAEYLDDMSLRNRSSRARGLHGLLTENGDLYSHLTDAPFLKFDLCSNVDVINQDRIYHHSLEEDEEGDFWMPNRMIPKTVRLGDDNFKDDGISHISKNGDVLFEKSVIQILDENDLSYLIYGQGKFNNDPIHLNDIQPVLTDGKYWNKGDVFLSIRELSMILLYRPSTNKVIWHRQGPWLHQHDVDVLNDHQILIFNNNAASSGIRGLEVRGHSNALLYDFDTQSIHSHFQEGFEKLDISAKTQGRSELIGDELFVEDTTAGRLVQFDKNGNITWQYVNTAGDGKVYTMNLSRIIPRELGDKVLEKVKLNGVCP